MLALFPTQSNNASINNERNAYMSDEQQGASEDQAHEPEGRAKGGRARAEALSDEQRRDIAKKAALARWGPRATHRGNFKEEFGIDVDCYVLDDEQKTAVISQRGMGEALGLGKGGSRLPRFLAYPQITPHVGPELKEKLQNPLVFQGQPVGQSGETPFSRIYGYDVTILIDICKAVLSAEQGGSLTASQKRVALQCHVVLNASAKAGIKGLVYALSGYDASREEVVRAFKMYVREEAREYEKEFPDQLYREWYRLYQLPRPERNKPWKFKHLTINQVYRPLARSNGKILELTRANRESSGKHYRKLFQFLSEIGVKALRQHLGQLLGIAQVSESQAEYEKHLVKVFGGQLDLFD
jgi:hypothetical protein